MNMNKVGCLTVKVVRQKGGQPTMAEIIFPYTAGGESGGVPRERAGAAGGWQRARGVGGDVPPLKSSLPLFPNGD